MASAPGTADVNILKAILYPAASESTGITSTHFPPTAHGILESEVLSSLVEDMLETAGSKRLGTVIKA